MTLSPLLVDTYRRYKRGTAKFVQWLAETARLTGSVDALFDGDAQKTTTGKKKGKARAKPKKPKTYLISVLEFTRLADAIMSAPSRPVPISILSTLKDVIQARRECATWYRAHQTDNTDATKTHNDGHQYFISVLENLYLTLEPQKEVEIDGRKEGAEGTSKFTNMFEYLEMEECEDIELLEGGMPDRPRRKKKNEDTYTLGPSAEDVSFALYCYIKDFTDLRIFVRRTWREYKHNHTTLTTAATVANTAIDVFRRLNESFIDEFPQFEDHAHVIAYLYNGYCDPNSCETIDDNAGNFAVYESDGLRLSSKTFFCDHTLHIVKSFYAKGRQLPFFQQGIMPTTENDKALLQCLSILGLVNWMTKDWPNEYKSRTKLSTDQVLRAVSVMTGERKFFTWVIFAIQVFVDTRCELGDQVARGFHDLQKDTDWLITAADKCLEFGKSNKINPWHNLNDQMLHGLIQSMEGQVKIDIIQGMIDENFSEVSGYNGKYNWGEFFLFKNHPMLCGILLQDYLVKFHRLGTNLAGEQGPLKSAMHLTHAARLAERLPPDVKWADLDYIMEMHGDSWIFVGERPETLYNCFSRFHVAFGVTATLLSRDKNQKGMSRLLAKKQDGHRTRELCRRIYPLSRYALLTEQKDGKSIKFSRAASDPGVMLEALVNKFLDTDGQRCRANPRGPKAKAPRHMTSLHSLTLFKQAMKEDEFPLRFDMTSLHKRCVELFRCIQKLCIELSPQEYPVAEFGSQNNINGVVGHMLAGVAGVQFTQPSRFLEACLLIHNVVAKHGNAEYIEAQARVGIVSGTADALEDDPENFEIPITDHLPYEVRTMIENYTPEELQQFKNRLT